jgi:integrase
MRLYSKTVSLGGSSGGSVEMTNKLTEIQIKKLKPRSKRFKVFDSSGLGLYLEIHPTGRKVFKQKYRIEGIEKTDTLKPEYPNLTLAKARQQALLNKGKHEQGVDTSKEKAKKKLVTLEDVAWLWLDSYKLEYPKKYEETKNRMVKHLFPYFKSKNIKNIDRQDIKDWIISMRKKGIKHTALRIKQNLVKIWEEARDRRILSENIVSGIEFKKPKGTPQRAEVVPERFALILLRIDRAKYTSIEQEVGIKLMPHLFSRHSELCRAKWQDMDFTKGVWHYEQKSEEGNTRFRTIGLSKQVINLLNTLPKTSEYIFPSDLGEKGHISSFSNNYNKIINSREEHSIHGFRASARTIIQSELKIVPDVIESALGHRVPDRLGDTYNRNQWLPEKIDMCQKWSDYLDKIKKQVQRLEVVGND